MSQVIDVERAHALALRYEEKAEGPRAAIRAIEVERAEAHVRSASAVAPDRDAMEHGRYVLELRRYTEVTQRALDSIEARLELAEAWLARVLDGRL